MEEKESTWIDLRKTSSTVVVAVTAGAFALLGTTLTAWQTLELERRKYEYSLISEILSEGDFDQETSSQRLQFLVEIGVIKSINTRALKDRAKEENLPSLPAFHRHGTIAYVNTPPGYAADIRWEPSTDSDISRSVRRGSAITLSGVSSNGWSQLIDGTWIPGNLLSLEPVNGSISERYLGVIRAPEGQAVNIRSGPGMVYPVVGQLLDRSSVSITDIKQNGWIQLANGNWVSEEHIVSPPQDTPDVIDSDITSDDEAAN